MMNGFLISGARLSPNTISGEEGGITFISHGTLLPNPFELVPICSIPELAETGMPIKGDEFTPPIVNFPKDEEEETPLMI